LDQGVIRLQVHLAQVVMRQGLAEARNPIRIAFLIAIGNGGTVGTVLLVECCVAPQIERAAPALRVISGSKIGQRRVYLQRAEQARSKPEVSQEASPAGVCLRLCGTIHFAFSSQLGIAPAGRENSNARERFLTYTETYYPWTAIRIRDLPRR